MNLVWQWDGCPLGLGLVAEDKPNEFSYTHMYLCTIFQFSCVEQLLHGWAMFDYEQSHHRVILHWQQLLHQLNVKLSP